MRVPGTLNTKTQTADFSWNELANAWRAANNEELEVEFNTHKLNGLYQWNKAKHWQGFTVAQVNKWLKDGYKVAAFEDVHSFAPHIERRRVRASDEGDLMYDAYLSGAEYPFITKNKIKTRPGLEIEAELAMLSDTPASVIEQYLVWLNRVAYTCEARGSDVALRIAHRSFGMLQGRSGSTLTRITVKRPGEWLDQTSWSPMLSPAGYRGFVFFAMILHAELAGVPVAGHLGQSTPTGRWGVHLEDGILRVTCPESAYSFPEESMTTEVKRLIQEYK